MKLTKYFMPFAALALLASCSNDKLDGPAENGGVENGESLYVNLKITQSLSTRTATPGQGVEIGKDGETKIGSVLLLFTPTNAHTVSVAAMNIAENFELVGKNGQYAASFKMLKDELEATSYNLYVIANPDDDIIDLYLDDNGTLATKKNTQIQDVFNLATDSKKYWTDNAFLMSSALEPETITITEADLAPGAHSTKTNPLQLGDVTVQRAMSRFDIAAGEALEFTQAKGNLTITGAANTTVSGTTVQPLKITIDGAALVNQSTKANIFKVGGSFPGWDNWDAAPSNEGVSTWAYFKPEWETPSTFNYVFSPANKTFTNMLFTATTQGTQVNLAGLNYTVDPINVGENYEDNAYTGVGKDESTNTVDADPKFYIWRYCMENTIKPGEGESQLTQKKGITTAIVFRAKITGGVFEAANGNTVYAYNNTLIGQKSELEKYTYEPSKETTVTDDINEIIAIHRQAAYDAVADKTGESNYQELLDAALVSKGFTVYKSETTYNDAGVANGSQYHCYYVYYNRHNDNTDPAVMGMMEFATVRNNVYKLWIKKINSLGHPGDPGDDPDPEDPDDPDESGEFWCEMAVKVLPWEVRINGIEF